MKAKNQLCLLCIIMTFILSSCEREDLHVDMPTFIKLGSRIEIDQSLRNNSSYYKTYTFMCDSDTILQYKYTNLLAPDQPIYAQFIPGTAFGQYCSDVKDSFAILPSVMEWRNPQEYTEVMQMPTPGSIYYTNFVISVASTYSGNKKNWVLADTTDAPNKIYYHFDWESKVHYDYMRYNADSAVITLSISNGEADNITPIDSAKILFPNDNIARMYNQFPLEIQDTISIVEDTTYNYVFMGYLKGQSSGENVHIIRTHKNEIISDQDQAHRYHGSVYEYDYAE